MEVCTAVALINNLVYKPGWEISAESHEKRFQGCIKVKLVCPTFQSERNDAPEYGTPVNAPAQFALIVDNMTTDEELYREVIKIIMKFEEHEAREFLRIKPTMWAPFHPHRADGMTRWNPDTVFEDLKYGIC